MDEGMKSRGIGEEQKVTNPQSLMYYINPGKKADRPRLLKVSITTIQKASYETAKN